MNDDIRSFLAGNHRAVLATRRSDGTVQSSPVLCALQDDHIVISSTEDRRKTKNLMSDPHASLTVVSDAFFGTWASVEGRARVVDLPDAMDGLVAYYRTVAGEHPNWDEYRQAMERDRRVLIVIDPVRSALHSAG